MNSSFRRNYTFYAFTVVFLALVTMYLFVSRSLAATGINADNSSGIYTYTQSKFEFQPSTNVSGVQEYAATSAADPYTIEGLKTLTALEFNASNLPQTSLLSFCVQSVNKADGYVQPLICEHVNLETSSSANWKLALPMGILVDASSNYYCEVKLARATTDDFTSQAIKGVASDCKLTFTPLANVQTVTFAINASLLNPKGQGSDLLNPTFSNFTAKKQLDVVGLYAAVGADDSLPEQEVSNICLNVGASRQCLPNYSFRAGSDGRYNAGYKAISQSISSGQDFNFSCVTEAGRSGACSIFAYVKIPAADLAAVTSALPRRDYFEIKSSASSSYCTSMTYFYKNTQKLLQISDQAKLTATCTKILGSSEY